MIRPLPPYFDYKTRIVYRRIELVNSYEDIQHPVVRAVLQRHGNGVGYEIVHDGDVPQASGVGSSSSFVVGLLNAIYAMEGRRIAKHDLAEEAIDIERHQLNEPGGWQDQIFAAFGGANRIDFNGYGFAVRKLVLPAGRMEEVVSHLMLFFTGFQREAAEIEARKIASLADHRAAIRQNMQLVDEVEGIIHNGASPDALGPVLRKGWELKQKLAIGVTSSAIDALYHRAIEAGSTGAKVVGAGGGGFLMAVVAPERQANVRAALHDLIEVPVRIDNEGSRVVVYEPNLSYR